MNEVRISDVTMKQVGKGFSLSVKEKLELSQLLDKLGVAVIEAEGIQQTKIDSLRIKSISTAVKRSILAVPVELNRESVQLTWNALKEANHPRLQVVAPVSPVRMEYIYHKKPDAMLADIHDTVTACCEVAGDVEFIADDATRSDGTFLYKAVETAIAAGAKTITVCDAAGTMLPDEFTDFVNSLYENVPALKEITLGISSSNGLAMADACAIAAIRCGAREIKAAAYQMDNISLTDISRVLAAKGDTCGVYCTVRTTEMKRIINQIIWMCETGRSKNSPFDNGVQDLGDSFVLTNHDDMHAVLKAVEKLGYDLSEEDGANVWNAFRSIAARKEEISSKELDTIVASVAMQVPATFVLDSYVITSSNVISSVAHIKVRKNGQVMEGLAPGDGSIDAAFMALEQIVGCHYDLDDFQIQSVTEGREAVGETLVKLRSNGKLYSGRGISTDIVGASIHAYINALNKIVYEEAEV